MNDYVIQKAKPVDLTACFGKAYRYRNISGDWLSTYMLVNLDLWICLLIILLLIHVSTPRTFV